jgi:hypothetical protein
MNQPDALTEETVDACPFCSSTMAPALLSAEEIEGCDGSCGCNVHNCNDRNFAVCCTANSGGCGAIGGYETSKGAAINKWNRRTS